MYTASKIVFCKPITMFLILNVSTRSVFKL